jgi:4-amino-4-deoxy-L-arabinose transferase-like glycosyltransferase
LIIGAFEAFGYYGELPVRTPMMISLFLFVLVIFYLFRKELNLETAAVSSIMFLTCGRVLIYESQYGLIDLTFSLLTFTFFLTLYRNFNRGNLLRLFVVAYLITAVSFLLKGLPSLVFLAISLLVILIPSKKFKLLFNWRHFSGIAVFIIIVGAYYVLYFIKNDVQLKDMLNVLIGESTRRTPVRFGIWKTILHIFEFPLDVIYHFLPWTILFIVLFKKGIIKKIKANHFLSYLSLIFIFNILVYWISPEIYPRYILMFMPIFFGVTAYFYLELKKDNSVFAKIVEIVFGVIIGLALIMGFIPFFKDISHIIPGILWIASGYIIILALINFLFWNQQKHRIYYALFVMIVLRFVFGGIIIPVRLADSNELASKQRAAEIVKQTEGSELYLYWNPKDPGNGYYGRVIINYRLLFNLVQANNDVITVTSDKKEDAFYICPHYMVKLSEINLIDKFNSPGTGSDLYLFQFK